MFYDTEPQARDAVSCKYELKKKEIGEGSYSRVFEAKNKKTGGYYAVKQYQKRLVYGMEEELQREFDILKVVSREHANILTLVDYFETKHCFYLVTGLAKGGELFSHIIDKGKLLEKETKDILRSVLLATKFLHSKNIVHRDLKPENILFSTKNLDDAKGIVVADFGLARHLPDPSLRIHDVCGTLSYMAPEMFDTKLGHSFSVDIWALGVMTYFMLGGFLPFDCETDQETKNAIKTRDFGFDWYPEYWDPVSQDAKDFINSCLELDSYNRINATNSLNHKFLSGDVSKAVILDLSPSPVRPLHHHTSSYVQLRECLSRMNLPHLSSSPATQSLGISGASSSGSTGSIFELLRAQGMQESVSVQGAYCESPQVFTTLNSPAYSLLNSRNTSTDNMVQLFAQNKRIPNLSKK